MDKQREEMIERAEGYAYDHPANHPNIPFELMADFALAQLQTAVAQNEKLTADRDVAVKALEEARSEIKRQIHKGDSWVPIHSVEDLPKECGIYLWQFRGNNQDINSESSKYIHKAQHFSPKRGKLYYYNADFFAKEYEAYMPIQPFNPVPTTE